MYPDGEVKYKCASRGYTAWWQRKTYFTFLTAYILVVPAVITTQTAQVRPKSSEQLSHFYSVLRIWITIISVYFLVVPAVIITFCYVSVVRVVWNSGRDVVWRCGWDVMVRYSVRDVVWNSGRDVVWRCGWDVVRYSGRDVVWRCG